MKRTILLLEDEPLILMDLEFAAQDAGCEVALASSVKQALAHVSQMELNLTAAVLDVSLGEGESCFPVAEELERLGVPYILHSGDLDRNDERIRKLGADIIGKPAASDAVIEAALARAAQAKSGAEQIAADER